MLHHAHPKAANPFESCLRGRSVQAGLTLVPQYEIRAGGVLWHPDLVDPIRGLVLEADSWTWHAARAVDHDRDCQRYNALTLEGWQVYRFSWHHVMDPAPYLDDFLRALATGGPPPMLRLAA